MIKGNIKLGEFASVDVDDLVLDISKSMKNKMLRNVYVLDKNKLIGVISLFDINNKIVAESKDPKKVSAKEIMSSPVICVGEESEIKEAYLLMLKEGKYVLPVVNKEGALLGTISMGQALKHSVNKYKNENSKK